jgi:hypothetical protein
MLDTCQLCEGYTEVMFAKGVLGCYSCLTLTEGDTPEEDYDTTEL